MKLSANKAAALLLALSVAFSFASCDKKQGSTASESKADSNGGIIHENRIKQKDYSFPQFLAEIGEADMLSNPVFRSFDPAQLMFEPEKQPFSDYKCTACFDNKLFVFKEGDNYGLLDMNGKVLVESTGIKKISAAAADLLQIKYEDSTTGYFHVDSMGGEFTVVEDFDSSRISFRKNEATPEYTESYYSISLDGNDIYSAVWDTVEEYDEGLLKTSKSYEAVYRAESASGVYYICFDRFFNFAVYEAAYGFVSLKAGGEYGECYILNSDDYSELETLISSFGRETSAELPSKDENEDFIRIVFGTDGESGTVTVSSDGYCLTEEPGEKPGERRAYFSVMSTETFVDLVNWVDTALAAEYQ